MVASVRVSKVNAQLESLKEAVARETRGRYSLETIKDAPSFRAYRAFFWRINIDPTKNRPAAEALIRRLVGGKPFPTINTLVDAYNVSSVRSEIALATFDAAKLKGDLTMDFAAGGEHFQGIGMDSPQILKGGEVIISDAENVVALYPHRDADYSKVTEATDQILLLVCGVPGISSEMLNAAEKFAVEYITQFCSR
ncbi:MAG: B3/4 domain-containing protein [Candidatus Bathyarchaeia archaeon]